jgi:hypothetical protein
MALPTFRNPLGRVESRTLSELKYRITHPARPNGRFIIDAVIQVGNGVRFLCDTWPTRPSETLIYHRCAHYGEFSKRPYVCGQATDDSTQDCVLALYYDYCRRQSLDATRLLVQAYPGGESAEQWSPVTWRRILDGAQWHGTEFPDVWTSAAILDLLVSLKGQQRSHLAVALAEAIGLRNVPRLLGDEGEAS